MVIKPNDGEDCGEENYRLKRTIREGTNLGEEPKFDILYTLSVTGTGGYPITDDIFADVLKIPRIPNTFSPNGDGINDLWAIQYLDEYTSNHLQVFTRAGQLVFESHGLYKAWDGNYKGKALPMDTYYYIIEPGSGRDPVTGYVMIMR